MSPQLAVLDDLLAWLGAGHRAVLLTVCSTWSSSSCECGSLCAIREDGRLSGSVSGGLIEDELIDLVRTGVDWHAAPRLLCYTGGNAEERRLPAGAQLTIALEPAPGVAELQLAVQALRERRVVSRQLDLASGRVRVEALDSRSTGAVSADGHTVRTLLRPAWRVWPLAGEGMVQAIRRVARFVHFEVVSAQPDMRAGSAPPDAIMAPELDALTIVLALDEAPLALSDALLEAIARHGAPLCVQTRNRVVAAGDAYRRIVSEARTPEEVAVAALAALVELRAARLAGNPAACAAATSRPRSDADALALNE